MTITQENHNIDPVDAALLNLKSEPDYIEPAYRKQVRSEIPAIAEMVSSHNNSLELVVSQPVDVDRLPDQYLVSSKAMSSEMLNEEEAEQMSVDSYKQQPSGSQFAYPPQNVSSELVYSHPDGAQLVGLHSFDHEALTFEKLVKMEDLNPDHIQMEAFTSDLEQQLLQVSSDMVDSEPSVPRKRSQVWKHFKIETVDPGPPVVKKAVCMVCNQAFSYRTGSKVNGTSHLIRHIAKGKCPLKSLDHQKRNQLILSLPNSADSDTNVTLKRRRKIPIVPRLIFDQDRCRSEIARMIIMHEYPLHMVEHQGLVSFLQHLQPRFGMVDFKTVQRDCVDTHLREKEKLQKLIDAIPGHVSLTLDVWTSNQTTAYVFLHGQFSDHEWNLQRCLLNVVMEPFPESDTALSHAVATCLSDWNLDNKLCSVTLNQPVSGTASAKLRGLLCIQNPLIVNGQLLVGSCLAHTLTEMALDLLAAGQDAVGKIRSYVKQQLQNPSGKGLVLDKATRWDTTYHMLVSAIELKEVLCCLDEYDVPTLEQWKQAENVCDYLKLLFETANLFVSRIPPSTNVLFHEILKIMEKLATSNASVSVQEKFLKYWKECWVLLAIAVTMDPRYKTKFLEFCFSKHLGEDAGDYIRAVDKAVQELFHEYSAEEDEIIKEDDEVTRTGLSDFDAYVMETARKEAKPELERYLNESLLPRGDDDFDVLGWWKVNKVKYPVLSKMARDVLSVPLSSVGSDYVFCTAAKKMEEGRSSLKPETIEALTCTKEWLHYDLTR